MAYEEIDYQSTATALPPQVQALVDAAEIRFGQFYADKLNQRYPRYIASEPAQVYAALLWVTDRELAPGLRFIEWGSGFGVATGMAALLGYTATGIELRAGLVAIARELLASQSIDAEFLCTSYIPDGFIEYDIAGGSDLVADDSFGYQHAGGPVYQDEEQKTDIAEIDLFYAYPWPGEQEMMLKLFDAIAEPDAILFDDSGDHEICIYRKL